jgi:leader peptidase (prepilin peptidase) / N-methyltransferase
VILGAGVLGALIGSFLNVCIYRLPRDLSVATPRSFCPSCGATIAWRSNIPIVSFFVQRRQCLRCRARIPYRYAIVEIITAVLFLFIAANFGISLSSLKWAIFESILIVLFWTDLEKRLLLDELTLGGLGIGLVFSFFVPLDPFLSFWIGPSLSVMASSVLDSVLSAALFGGLFWTLRYVFWRLRGKEGLGLGDVKLAAMLGAFLGLQACTTVLLGAALFGCALGIPILLLSKRNLRTYPLPFGSFLCAGAALWPLLRGTGF